MPNAECVSRLDTVLYIEVAETAASSAGKANSVHKGEPEGGSYASATLPSQYQP